MVGNTDMPRSSLLGMTQSNVSLQKHETLTNGLLRVIDALTNSATDTSAQPSRDDADVIHKVRTTIKRLRALLRLIRPSVEPSFFDRENERLRNAAGLLSFARDTEIARETLKSLPVSKPSDKQAVKSVLSGIKNRGEPGTDAEQTMAEVRERLEQTRRNFHRLKLQGAEREILEKGLRTVYRQGRNRMENAIEQRQDDAFHRWRIRAKNLYYELQFLESVSPKRLHRMVSRLSKLQDRIGLDHDIAVLRAWLQKKPEAFGSKEAVQRVIARLNQQTRKLRDAAVPIGQKIWHQKPRQFARKIARHWCKR